MGVRTVYKISGLEDTKARLREFSKNMVTRSVRSTTGYGAQRIADAVRQLAPVSKAPHKANGVTIQPGNLRKNVYVYRVTSRSQRGRLSSLHRVLVRKGRKTADGAFYAHFVEYGTVRTPPRSFLRAGFNREGKSALDGMLRVLKSETIKNAEKVRLRKARAAARAARGA